MFRKIPNYIKYIFSNFILLFAFNFVFRIIFYSFFAELDTATYNEVQKAFWLGFRFDIKLAAIAVFPLSLLVLIVNRRFFNHSFYRKLSNVYLILVEVNFLKKNYLLGQVILNLFYHNLSEI